MSLSPPDEVRLEQLVMMGAVLLIAFGIATMFFWWAVTAAGRRGRGEHLAGPLAEAAAPRRVTDREGRDGVEFRICHSNWKEEKCIFLLASEESDRLWAWCLRRPLADSAGSQRPRVLAECRRGLRRRSSRAAAGAPAPKISPKPIWSCWLLAVCLRVRRSTTSRRSAADLMTTSGSS